MSRSLPNLHTHPTRVSQPTHDGMGEADTTASVPLRAMRSQHAFRNSDQGAGGTELGGLSRASDGIGMSTGALIGTTTHLFYDRQKNVQKKNTTADARVMPAETPSRYGQFYLDKILFSDAGGEIHKRIERDWGLRDVEKDAGTSHSA